MKSAQRLKQYEVSYVHHQQRDLHAQHVSELGGLYLHQTIYNGYCEKDIYEHFKDLGASVLSIKHLRRNSLLGSGISRSLKLQVLQSISFNCKAGLSPVKAFEQVASAMQGPARLVLNDGLRALQQGANFSDAIEMIEWFDESTIAVLRTGENTGQLAQAIHSAVAHYSRSSELIKIIIGTVIFTSFDLVMAVSSIVGTRFGLIPSVKKQGITTENPEIKENFEQSLELATFVNDWLLGGTIGLIVAIVVIIAMLMSKDIALRRKGAYVLKRTPVLGALLENAAMSNSLTILSSLIESGVRMSNALTITLRATHHEGCLIYLRGIQNELSKGVSLRQAFAKDPMSIAEKIVIQSSNDSAQLSHSLKNIAQSREDIGKQLAKRFAMLALVISLGYSGISVGFSLWVVYIQNSALLGGG